MPLLLNCDLAESDDPGALMVEERVMPHIHVANIACGFHAGNEAVMQATLDLARRHGARVAAHPGYPDREHFGRRSLTLTSTELARYIREQLETLGRLAEAAHLPVEFVKPHGALYHDMVRDERVRDTIMRALGQWDERPTLIMLATTDVDRHRHEAAQHGLNIAFEAFADRGYDDTGLLLPRHHSGALLHGSDILRQVEQLQRDGTITTVGGRRLPLAADTLCIHGDHAESVAIVAAIRRLLDGGGSSAAMNTARHDINQR